MPISETTRLDVAHNRLIKSPHAGIIEAILERACTLANEAMFTIALQRRRVRSDEPEDDVFVMRRWTDLQFLIVALRRLRRSAELARRVPSAGSDLDAALKVFDDALPQLSLMRNVGEFCSFCPLRYSSQSLDPAKENDLDALKPFAGLLGNF